MEAGQFLQPSDRFLVAPGALIELRQLKQRVAEFGAKHLIGTVPRPPHWSGFRLQPHLIEFWQDGAFRLHDRLTFMKTETGWAPGRLYP